MREEYEKELKDLTYKMEKAEAFAKELPLFSKEILYDKLQSDALWIKFGSKYKGVYFDWGINRVAYETGTIRTVTNYRGDAYKASLFCIYVNTLSMYDSHEEFGLGEICDKVPLFFYDKLNTTFYATDSQIEELLNALADWHSNAIEELKAHNKAAKIEKLEAEILRLNENN